MGVFGGFYKGDKKKKKRQLLEKEASKIYKTYAAPQVEIIGKKRKST